MKRTNKFTAMIISVVLVVTLITPMFASAAAQRLLGDADGSGSVSVVDATLIQRYLAKLSALDDESKAAADADGDGVVSVMDSTVIQRYLAKISTPYPVGEPIDTTNDDAQSSSSLAETETQTEATEAVSETEVTGDEWKENTGTIVLSDSGITVTGEGIYVEGNVVYITEGGDWEVTGTCSDGMIYVNTGEEKDVNDKVKLRLSGMSLTNTDGPAIYFDRCKKAFITLEAGTENYVEDGTVYSDSNAEAKAAIHSDDTLEIKGKGSLTVKGNYKHGINSDDDMIIENGVFDITSATDALHANDDITLEGKNISLTLNASADGIDSEGTLNLTLADSVNITAGKKGIKAEGDIIISAGTYTIDSADDCINGSSSVTINGGTYKLTSGDDGIHADATLTIENGDINITKSYEGLEGNDVIINGGDITVVASDDGINSAGGSDQSSLGGRPGQNQFAQSSSSNSSITVNGGNIYVRASGDGIDSNGSLSFNGGAVVVEGPSNGGNFALDADGSVGFNGGTVMALCSSNAMWNDLTGKISGAVYNTNIGSVSSGSVVCVTDADGNVLSAQKTTLSGNIGIVYFSDKVSSSADVKFVRGGSYSGTLNDNGYGEGGTVSGGTSYSPSTSSGGWGGNPGTRPGGRF